MADNKNPQKNKKSYKETERSEFLKRAYEDVWQDRSAPECARVASVQASRTERSVRAHGLNKNSDQSQKTNTSRKTVQAVGWVLRPRSILIDECAQEWGTTRSQA